MEPPIRKEELSEALKQFEANYTAGGAPVPPTAPNPGLTPTPPPPLAPGASIPVPAPVAAPAASGELGAALQQFQASYSKDEEQKKARVDKIEDKDTDTPPMVLKVMKYSGGLIKDERQAQYALLGLVIIMLGLSAYFFFGSGPSTKALPAFMNPGIIPPPPNTSQSR